jgi:hypothetical protein
MILSGVFNDRREAAWAPDQHTSFYVSQRYRRPRSHPQLLRYHTTAVDWEPAPKQPVELSSVETGPGDDQPACHLLLSTASMLWNSTCDVAPATYGAT